MDYPTLFSDNPLEDIRVISCRDLDWAGEDPGYRHDREPIPSKHFGICIAQQLTPFIRRRRRPAWNNGKECIC